ncbi:carbohydrate kinase [Rhodothermaceae bacterium RA]|nr:carbohydrate kinase [Rhodothermaceae bacterium RA]
MPAYLAFDLGASSGRAILGRLEAHRMHMDELHRFKTPIIEEEGHLYWDLDAIWRHLQTGLRKALDAAPDLRSVSVNSWGVDYVPLDAEGRPLRRPFVYRDPRVKGRMEAAWEVLPAPAIYAATGIQFMPINTLYQVLADQEEEPARFGATRNRLMMADYFNHRLGGRAVAEVSLASTSQLMDARTQTWSTEVLEAFGIPADTWPPIVPSGTRIGTLREHPAVTIIASCSHDTADAVAATPAAGARPWAYLSCGTWSLLGVERAEPLLSEAARRAGFTNEAGLDGTIRFLKNITGLWMLQECERAWRQRGDTYTYDELMAEAEAAPPTGGPLDLTDPRFAVRGDMQARIVAYGREHGIPIPEERGPLVRTILESLARAHRDTLRDLEAVLGTSIDVLHIVGGGARNRLLCQWTADACGCEVVAGPAEATALGNLLIQARTMGDLDDGVSIRDVVRHSTDLVTYRPSPRAAP